MSIAGSPVLTKLSLQPLAQRLGVEGIVQAVFDPVVRPVAIVDGSVAAIALQTLDVPATAGALIAPAINTRLADSGPLVAGQWNMTIMIGAGEGNRFTVRRRNAADAADIWSQVFWPTGSPNTFLVFQLRMQMAQGERLVIDIQAAGAAGITYQASLWAQGPF